MLPTLAHPRFSLWLADCFHVFDSIEDKSIDLILADLPYGTTSCPWDSVLDLPQLWKEYKRMLKRNGAVILTAAQPFTWRLCSSNPEWFKYEIIWEKTNGTCPQLVNNQPFRVHENILVFYKYQPTYNPQMIYGKSKSTAFHDRTKKLGEVYQKTNGKSGLYSRHRANVDGSRYPRSVQVFGPDERGKHPTKKPIALMAWLIKSYTNPGDLVLDNTMGEGTTGIACMQTGRDFFGIEKVEKYYTKAEQLILEAFQQQSLIFKESAC